MNKNILFPGSCWKYTLEESEREQGGDIRKIFDRLLGNQHPWVRTSHPLSHKSIGPFQDLVPSYKTS